MVCDKDLPSHEQSTTVNDSPPCSKCGTSTPPRTPTASGPYALNKLIPTGTITLQLNPEQKETACNHYHMEDGWLAFENANKSLFCHAPALDNDFHREINFLIKHRFISVTYRSARDIVVLRIYIIPYDLPNVLGKLRIRKEAVLASARRYMKNLLPMIVQNQEAWNFKFDKTASSSALLPNNQDSRTLSDIYGDMKSPNPTITPGCESIMARFLDFNDNLGGLGIRSSLYKYQRRSVAAMIQREMDTRDILDYLFIPLVAMNKVVFYLQPGTFEILLERPMVAGCRSGILCEELGTGKTVMTLSLILATIRQISSPEESIIDNRPVLTPLSFRYFPSLECTEARRRFFQRRDNPFSTTSGTPVFPSLVELLLDQLRTNPDTRLFNTNTTSGLRNFTKQAELEMRMEQISQAEHVRLNAPFYHHYAGEPSIIERSSRKNESAESGPRVVYLTSATLIVVPSNLISQWDREIHKHCEYPLRTLILRPGSSMPSPIALASDYDIILMTYKRFTMENSYNKIDNLHSRKCCMCQTVPGCRIPDCKCKELKVSPLLQIRWKRLVIDEGHVSASLSSVLTPFTKLLSVERRWIVTGTPTTNLLGLSFGKKSDIEMQGYDEGAQSDQAASDSEFEGTNSTPDISVPPSRSESMSIPTADQPSRVWNKYDREDLGKLGKMISHFIAVPQFNASKKLVSSHIIEPLLDPKGPRSGAIQVLNQVMEMVMIRHRIEDVEKDVILPPVSHESILLDLDPYAAKSYNAFQASIAINAVDSQRTDQDYLFHPGNSDLLQLTVKNMSQILFWSTNETLFNVDEMSSLADDFAKRAQERKVSPEDIVLLREAIKHVTAAAEDPLWRAIQSHEDIPYRVSGLPENIFKTWTRTPQREPGYNQNLYGLVHLDRLLKMQDQIVHRPLMSEDMLVSYGRAVADDDELVRKLYVDSQKGKDNKTTQKAKQFQDVINAGLMVEDATKRAKDPDMLKEMKKDLDAAIARLNAYENEDGVERPSHASESHGGRILSSSILASVRLGSTASSKLNYIINEVLQYAAKEKFLIFSESELTLAHVAETLQLMHVKFLRFTTQIDPRRREEIVLTFETSNKYRIFLMELKHGARGLNLISASRVIFCEPVWYADVESQAIKRAHRIGQTRAISVKTLAIHGTAEETMVARRNALSGCMEKLPKLIEEAGVRHFIANPRFISYEPERYSTVDMPLLVIRDQDAGVKRPHISSSRMHIQVADPTEEFSAEVDKEPSPKKRKVLRFE